MYYVITTMFTNMMDFGSLLREPGKRFTRLVSSVPALLPPLVVAYLLAFTAYFVETLVARGALSSAVAWRVNYVIKVSMLIGMMVYSFVPSTDNWPFSQKGTFVVQVTVLLMKMHS